MTNKQLEKKIKDLEERIRQLENRVVYIPIPYNPVPAAPVSPNGPYLVPYCTPLTSPFLDPPFKITCGEF